MYACIIQVTQNVSENRKKNAPRCIESLSAVHLSGPLDSVVENCTSKPNLNNSMRKCEQAKEVHSLHNIPQPK
jgi:hypothetical protein